MLAYLILLFTLVPLFELYLLIRVGQVIGAWNTVLIVVFTGIAGAYLAKLQGLGILKRIQDDLHKGLMPTGKLIDGVFVFVAGVLLITPGILTDILGFLFLIPYTRNIFKTWLKYKFQDILRQGKVVDISGYSRQQQNYNTDQQPQAWMPAVECPICKSTNTRFLQPHYEMSIYECLDCNSRFEIEE